jgi:phosphatidylserine/phosphatidylglycerophosphate/cardiolipin synthase-like enzyme
VRALSALFRADWDRLPVEFSDPNLIVSPANARTKLTALLRLARHLVEIDAEELADPAIERLLISLARRGVRVRVLLPPPLPSSAAFVRRAGVQVRAQASPYMHAKVIVIDDRLAFVGSENLSTTSLDQNREVGVLLRGPAVQELVGTFNGDWSRDR